MRFPACPPANALFDRLQKQPINFVFGRDYAAGRSTSDGDKTRERVKPAARFARADVWRRLMVNLNPMSRHAIYKAKAFGASVH